MSLYKICCSYLHTKVDTYKRSVIFLVSVVIYYQSVLFCFLEQKKKTTNFMYFGRRFQYLAVAMSEVDVLKTLARQMSSYIL